MRISLKLIQITILFLASSSVFASNIDLEIYNKDLNKQDIYIFPTSNGTGLIPIKYDSVKSINTKLVSKKVSCHVNKDEITGYLLEGGESNINPTWHTLVPLGPNKINIEAENGFACPPYACYKLDLKDWNSCKLAP